MNISVVTEITDKEVKSLRGWVLFDAGCSLCTASAHFFDGTLKQHGFAVAPLQTPWVRERLGLKEGEPLNEMRLLLANGEGSGGVDAIIQIAKHIWWAKPLFIFAKLPGVKVVLGAAYRIIADNRHCVNGLCNVRRQLRWFDWLPLIVLPAAIIALRFGMAAWVFMWALAASIFMGCKWLTFRRSLLNGWRPSIWHSLAYFFAWPGMDAAKFLEQRRPEASKASKGKWLLAFSKAFAGAALVWFAARGAFGAAPLVTGWMGMLGIILFLHFGVFELLALAWQKAGINAKPVMQSPLVATSLAEFWSTRWNTAFNVLAHDLAFRPLARKIGVVRATLGVFLISGIVHELVISLPARGGFGLPTAYFLFQGAAALAERTGPGRRAGLGHGFRGWLFTIVCAGAPAFWLFHPPFVTNVILPMLQALGRN